MFVFVCVFVFASVCLPRRQRERNERSDARNTGWWMWGRDDRRRIPLMSTNESSACATCLLRKERERAEREERERGMRAEKKQHDCVDEKRARAHVSRYVFVMCVSDAHSI